MNRRGGVFSAAERNGNRGTDLVFRYGGGQRDWREGLLVEAFERLAVGVDAVDAEPVGFADVKTARFDRRRRDARLVVWPRLAAILGELDLVGYGAGNRGPCDGRFASGGVVVNHERRFRSGDRDVGDAAS